MQSFALLPISFLAGVLTILAPCVLPILPVIIGGSAGETEQNSKWRPLIIVGSLGVSVILFTLILKASTALIGIPPKVWEVISGTLVLLFGLTMVFPTTWEKIAFKLKLYKSEEVLAKNSKKSGNKGAVLLGASLGPVFTSCSPTYAIILAVVLPQSLSFGLLNIIVYTIGLLIPLLLIGYGGRKIASRFKGAANPKGWFKKILGLLLVTTGIMVIFGLHKDLEAYILNQLDYGATIEFEQNLLDKFEE